ncbi:S8 family serine peptidase [Paraburkholderia fungorum]|uniref:S8 family serine peptidase n=1 Tax=Paraburkholderia fungorum TaxID=134537 RepID=UPI001C1F1967|nr:S8 family serine peptidase [Paraburkholderia fungorum]MBU7437439.1 S8 family serine peptidase [Paraburkholderia fungorum]
MKKRFDKSRPVLRQAQLDHTTTSRAKKLRAALLGATYLSLSLALTACGGRNDVDSADQTIPSATNNAATTADDSRLPSRTAMINTSGMEAGASNDRFIVKYRDGTSERTSPETVQPLLNAHGKRFGMKARHLRRLGVGADLIASDRKLTAVEATAFMRDLASNPDVEYVEADVPMHTTMTPNDPDYAPRQWALQQRGNTSNWPAGIRPEQAWDISNGSGVVIAMLDNGVTPHSDLDANLLAGYDFTASNRGGNGSNPGLAEGTCGVTWHGTHVAGILAALTNNGKGMAGTAWGAKVVPVRVLNGCGSGLMSDVADGITWAAGGTVSGVPANPFPARVLNLSLGGNGNCSITYQQAIDDATARGASVVVAAGNDNLNAGFYQPGNCQGVIVASSLMPDGRRGNFANYGPVVDIAAPGENIWSTWNSGERTPAAESNAYLSGTSMAAPFVSGVIALAQAVAPKPLTAPEVRSLLMQNARTFVAGSQDMPLGAGMLDATATVEAARSGKIPTAADFRCVQKKSNVMQLDCQDLSSSRSGTIVSRTWNFGAGADWTVTDARHWDNLNIEYAGNYNVSLKVTDSSGATSSVVRRLAVYEPPVLTLRADQTASFSANRYEVSFYSIVVPSGVKGLTVALSGGTGTATLKVRRDTPSLLNPICEGYIVSGRNQNCVINNPQPGTYYIALNASTRVQDVSVMPAFTN